MKVSGIMVGSNQPKVLGEFYTKILGKPMWQQDDWYGYGDENSSMMIGAHSEVKGNNKEPGRHIIFISCSDVKAEFEKVVKAANPKVVAKPYQPDPKAGDMWLATFEDPDGNYVQLATPWKE